MIKLDTKTRSMNLNETRQSIDYRFAWARKVSPGEYQLCHPWVKCRDYLHDAIVWKMWGEQHEQYGFTYDPNNDPPVSLKSCILAVTSNRPNFLSEVKRGKKILNILERETQFPSLSKILEINSKIVIFKGNAEWLSSTYLISLYSLLIRLSAQEFIKNNFSTFSEFKDVVEKNKVPIKGSDGSYMSQVRNYIKSILMNRHQISIQKFSPPASVHSLHNSCGVYSLVLCAVTDANLKSVIKTQILTS